jgi:hypothetical protein
MSRLFGSRRGARPQEYDDTTRETVQESHEGDEHRHSLSPGVPVRAIPPQGRTAAAREPCDRIPPLRDVGQWLCVPPFRVVCLYQALRMELLHCKYRTKQNKFNRKNYHTPSNSVVAHWTADVESTAPLDFCGDMTCGRRLGT